MAVTVTDTRTTINAADSATGWTIAGGGTAGTSVFAESTGSIISTLNIATGQIYYTDGTSRDLSNTLIYIWADNYALKGNWDAANPPTALHLGDGTDRISFMMSGANRKVFAHLDSGTGTTVDWECLVLDGSQAGAMNTAGLTVARAGSYGNLNMSAITQMGIDFTTLSKGLGGGTNVAVDIIRIGNDGLIVTGGTTGDRGTFLQIVNEDKSTADGKAHGIIREYTTGLYGLQGPLTFGDNPGTGTSWFQDTNVVLVFENRNIADDKYYFDVVSNSTGGANFILTNSTLTTAGPNVSCDFSDAAIDTLTITGCTFRALGNSIDFANDSAATSHTITGNIFDACGQINPGDVIFQDNTIASSTASATGAILLDADGTSNWANLNFVSGGTGHAIYITATGTYTFDNFTYSGYSTSSPGSNPTSNSGSTDAMIYNNSGGAVTINVAGGDTPTVRNGASATTVVNSNVNVTVTIQDESAEPIVGAQVAIFRTSDNAVILSSTPTDENGEVTTTYAASTGAIYIRARQSTNTATFATTAGVNGTTEVITTDIAHSFVDGEAIVYSKNGGSAVIGLTDGNTYYVNSISSTTLSLHTTVANAIADSSRVNLTASGSETHHLDPVRYYPNSTVGNIGSSDFSVTITLIEDTTVTG